MSNDEWKELSEKLHYGLALAEQRMLEKKAQRNETVIVGTPDGEIKPFLPAVCFVRQSSAR